MFGRKHRPRILQNHQRRSARQHAQFLKVFFLRPAGTRLSGCHPWADAARSSTGCAATVADEVAGGPRVGKSASARLSHESFQCFFHRSHDAAAAGLHCSWWACAVCPERRCGCRAHMGLDGLGSPHGLSAIRGLVRTASTALDSLSQAQCSGRHDGTCHD